VPTLYGASRLETAAFESVFRDRPADGKPWPVRESRLHSLAHAQARLHRALRLAPLLTPELAAMGITRAQLIDTPASAYGETVRWAAAIHQQFPDLDGLAWASHQDEGGRAYLLFGDRVDSGALEIVAVRPLAADPARSEIDRVAARGNIVIVP
jgi:hypothetical protein